MAFFASAHAAEVELKLATGTDYAPYTDPTLPGGGVITQLVEHVFAEAGYDITQEYFPWKRSYQRTLNLQNDATFPFAKDEKREAEFLFSRPINQINIRFYEYRATAVDIKTLDDMKGMTYCQPLGYMTEPELIELIDLGKLSRFEATDMLSCFKVLGLGRVDFVVANDYVAWKSAQAAYGADGFDFIKPAKEPLRTAYEHLIISRNHPNGAALIKSFNEAYDRLLADGTLQKIWMDALGKHARPAP